MELDVGGFTDVDEADAVPYIAYLDAGASLRQSGKAASFSSQGIGAGMCVLDLGCGTGDDVRSIAAIVGPAGQVTGVDSSGAMIAEAIRRGVPSNASFVQASAYALPFPEGSFDVCRAERVFQHLELPDNAAAELRRLLRPGGSLFIIDQDWDTLAVGGGDAEITSRVVRTFVGSLTNGAAGRNHQAMLTRAGFGQVHAIEGVTTLPFEHACRFVLRPAVERATARAVITAAEAEAWLATLADADRRGEFSYGVSAFAVFALK